MDEIEELKRQVDDLASREQIRDVLYSFTRYMDRADAAGLKRGYHPDAYEIHWETFTGNAHEFADHMTKAIRTVASVIHEITNPLIELDGDRAFVESRYTCRVHADFDGAPEGTWVELVVHGRYLDVFERRDGAWKIAHRRLIKEGSRVGLITDQPARPSRPEAEHHPWPDDLVYAGFGIVDMAPEPNEPVKDMYGWLRQFGKRSVKTETVRLHAYSLREIPSAPTRR